MQDSQPLGLREQKRLKTRRLIEDSATRLVDERGFKDVTIEEICEDAGISRRTFFNYFDSKDEAVLGSPTATFNDEQRERIINTPTDNLPGLILSVIEENLAKKVDDELWQRRQRIANDPNAAGEIMARRRATSSETTALLVAHFDANESSRRLPEVSAETEAKIVASMLRETLWVAMSACDDTSLPIGARFRAAAQLLTDYSKGLTW